MYSWLATANLRYRQLLVNSLGSSASSGSRSHGPVDRRSDNDHEVDAPVDHRGVGGPAQPSRSEHAFEHVGRPHLGEWHRSPVDGPDNRRVGVVQDDVEPAVGEGKAQGQAHMPTSPDYEHISLEVY